MHHNAAVQCYVSFISVDLNYPQTLMEKILFLNHSYAHDAVKIICLPILTVMVVSR